MRSGLTYNGSWVRKNGRYGSTIGGQNGMAKHVDAVMKRAKERCLAQHGKIEANTSRTASQRLTQPMSPHKRLRERAGLWMFAKQSEVITQPVITSSNVMRKVQEDIRTVMAQDTSEGEHMWNRAPVNTDVNIRNPCTYVSSPVSGTFDGPSCSKKSMEVKEPVSRKRLFTGEDDTYSSYDFSVAVNEKLEKNKNEDFHSFPTHPLMLDNAIRILSALPHLPLRNDDPAGYCAAATGILICALLRHGVQWKDSKFMQMERSESALRMNNANEKFWRSFFETSSPLGSLSPKSVDFTNEILSPTIPFDMEDIPIRENLLSSPDATGMTFDVHQSAQPIGSFLSGYNFGSFSNCEEVDDTMANLSVNPDNVGDIPYTLPMRQDGSEFDNFCIFSGRNWFERDSEARAVPIANSASHHSTLGNDMGPNNNSSLEDNLIGSFTEVVSPSPWIPMNNPLIHNESSGAGKKVEVEVPPFHFSLPFNPDSSRSGFKKFEPVGNNSSNFQFSL